MPRLRIFRPPPQDWEQADQSFQSSQAQSTVQAGWWQSRFSATEKKQPKPPGSRRLRTERSRLWMPSPQLVEQSPQSSHPETWQSWMLQLGRLQAFICVKSLGHSWPPCSGKVTTWRWRRACPAPQLRSHSSHSVQSDTTQSTGGRWQVSTSCMGPMHGRPPSRAGCLKTRSRCRCMVKPQAVHSDHISKIQSWLWPSPQSCQSPAWQSRTSSNMPLHCMPPGSACSMLRPRLWKPSPQVVLQMDQLCQALNSQGSGRLPLHALVCSRSP
mmetsp:Transcript_54313/g.129774  ORF Transcript_54313/g.129774 Transcript_54313/m.129774 type:complete len:270 (-) Transcript_54313:536-1345(-)